MHDGEEPDEHRDTPLGPVPVVGLGGRAGRVGMPTGREAGLAGRLGMADWGVGVLSAALLAPFGMERVFPSPSAHRPHMP